MPRHGTVKKMNIVAGRANGEGHAHGTTINPLLVYAQKTIVLYSTIQSTSVMSMLGCLRPFAPFGRLMQTSLMYDWTCTGVIASGQCNTGALRATRPVHRAPGQLPL